MTLHVAVSENASIFGSFNRKGATDSHFYVRRGTAHQIKNRLPADFEQYVDTAWRANADLEGNDATLSVETQGGMKSADTQMWDISQLLRMAELFAWARKTHGLKNQMATSSRWDSSSHGLAWHRLGVDGNFPALPNICAGRNQRGGGMKYSRSRGKLCPGCGKIKQIGQVFALSQTEQVSDTKPTPPIFTPPVLKPIPPLPKPQPVKPPVLTPVTGKTAEDGWWGPGTTGLLQAKYKHKIDKIISNQPISQAKGNNLGSGWEWKRNPSKGGSGMIAALQRDLRHKGFYKDAIDGFAGPNFWKAFRKGMGSLTQKGAITQMQKNLNRGFVWSK